MSSWLIAAIGVVYLVIAADLFFIKKDVGLAVAFLGYAIGNVGLYIKAVP